MGFFAASRGDLRLLLAPCHAPRCQIRRRKARRAPLPRDFSVTSYVTVTHEGADSALYHLLIGSTRRTGVVIRRASRRTMACSFAGTNTAPIRRASASLLAVRS